MSFRAEKREQIKHYFLEKLKENPTDAIKRTCNTFNISQNTVYRYIRELEEDRIISRQGQTVNFVQSYCHATIKLTTEPQIEEYDIFTKYILPHIESFSDNIFRIWQYSFTEMMNNALEHSLANAVHIGIWKDYLTTTILLSDNGVGIFKKIKEFYHYQTLDDAINALFKGKMTTDASRHSGEGIFFTSRMLDNFAAISDGKVFSHDKYFHISENIDISGFKMPKRGTTIYMEMSNFSHRTAKEIFDIFANPDDGFIKTRIPLKNIFDRYPVARSQAKRLTEGFEKFQEVELDFDGIDDMGQGFAHELFVVYQKDHPDIRLTPLNANEDVLSMLGHVLHT